MQQKKIANLRERHLLYAKETRNHKKINKKQKKTQVKTSDGVTHDVSLDLCYSIDSSNPYYVAPKKGRVRGTLYMAGYVFEKIDSKKSKAYYVVQMNPNGWIPNWLANLTLPQQVWC